MGAISARHGSLNVSAVRLLNIVIIFIVALVSNAVAYALRLSPGDDFYAWQALAGFCKLSILQQK